TDTAWGDPCATPPCGEPRRGAWGVRPTCLQSLPTGALGWSVWVLLPFGAGQHVLDRQQARVLTDACRAVVRLFPWCGRRVRHMREQGQLGGCERPEQRVLPGTERQHRPPVRVPLGENSAGRVQCRQPGEQVR